MRYLTGLVLVIAAGVGCSRGVERPVAASPTSPTAAVSAASAITFVGGVSGPMDVLFPGRNDSFQFRNDLEAKYQQMGRGVTSTFVDREGEVVWTQEYIRYRVNGCDHATAVGRVMTQIEARWGGSAASRRKVNPFRARRLAEFRRSSSQYHRWPRGSRLRHQGAVSWIQIPALCARLRPLNAESKVFSQIDGDGAGHVFRGCEYGVRPPRPSTTPASLSFRCGPSGARGSQQRRLWRTFTDDFATAGASTFPYSWRRHRSYDPRANQLHLAGGGTLHGDEGGIRSWSSPSWIRSEKDRRPSAGIPVRRPCYFVVTQLKRQLHISVAHLYHYGKRSDVADCHPPTFSFSDSAAIRLESNGETFDVL